MQDRGLSVLAASSYTRRDVVFGFICGTLEDVQQNCLFAFVECFMITSG